MQNHRFTLVFLLILLLLVPLCLIMLPLAGLGIGLLFGVILCSLAVFIYRWKMGP